VACELKDYPITFFNPRRPEWDNRWNNSGKNISAQMKRQINWELGHLESADFICMWIEPDSKSPISLLEKGLYSGRKKILSGVCRATTAERCLYRLQNTSVFRCIGPTRILPGGKA
jgi:hypothetical protein